ncbi:MAG: hypothetical protein DWH79_01865 [Planctomycetota bacterium]|nr:MAG: hypothetical protein DWH79_01865 [Planctomycetota bacterium]
MAIESPIDQPTTLRLKRTRTTGAETHPSSVLRYAMSATHFRFSADAVKSRSIELRAGFWEGSTTVVVVCESHSLFAFQASFLTLLADRGATGDLEPESLIVRFGDLPTAVDLTRLRMDPADPSRGSADTARLSG